MVDKPSCSVIDLIWTVHRGNPLPISSQSAPDGINLSEVDRLKSRRSINGFRSNARGDGHELVLGARFAKLDFFEIC